jgi:hypothetical protein
MEGLNTQLQKSLTENTRLEEQLKDQERLKPPEAEGGG